MRRAVLVREVAPLGPAIEAEAIERHMSAMTSTPAIHYWLPGTLEVLSLLRSLRAEGIGVWATLDAGPNVHMICEPQDETIVASAAARSGQNLAPPPFPRPPAWICALTTN